MKVLVVEDSPRMAQTLRKGLSEEGFAVEIAEEGNLGLEMSAGGDFDIVLLDVNLPGRDGMSLIKELRRRRSDVPVIMVTARDALHDRIEGLDSGADDYLTKPFSFEELLARMRAVMRRPGSRAQEIFSFEDITLNPASGQAKRGERHMHLSAREFALLRVLLANANSIVSRARLYESVWGTEYDGNSNVLDVYINYLRNKLEEAGEKRVLHTVRGRGYVLGEER